MTFVKRRKSQKRRPVEEYGYVSDLGEQESEAEEGIDGEDMIGLFFSSEPCRPIEFLLFPPPFLVRVHDQTNQGNVLRVNALKFSVSRFLLFLVLFLKQKPGRGICNGLIHTVSPEVDDSL